MHLKVLDNSVWCQESFQLPSLLLVELKRETLAFFTLGYHQYWWLYIVHYIWVEAWILLYNISDIVLPFKHVKDFMCLSKFWKNDLDGIMQERHNSIANALELRISCSNPSMCNGIKKKMACCCISPYYLINFMLMTKELILAVSNHVLKF